MRVFLDTSALYALLDRDDANNGKAQKAWNGLLAGGDSALLTTNYIVVECVALIQHRLGLEAARGFHEDLLPIVNIEWVDAEIHRAGVSAFLSASRRRLSLVDCVSFEVMRTLGVKTAFAFDAHFLEQGFRCLP
ncbi:MAG: type II toxin-antitoxin system VapC family toxin [Nitrospinae bacterium]|nr:type II toxin-antitoxin system VapC family toxin [Nitrospinota bacterium]